MWAKIFTDSVALSARLMMKSSIHAELLKKDSASTRLQKLAKDTRLMTTRLEAAFAVHPAAVPTELPPPLPMRGSIPYHFEQYYRV